MASIGTIGKYERLDVLGHGTSGVVYLAWDTLLRRNVALKEIRAAGPELDKVLDEARVLDRLGRHPHIVQVHSVDSIGGAVLIDMELISGGNLADLLRERAQTKEGQPLPPAEAIRIATAVLDALQFAHERRIIHRDIKPANILIGANGLVKLTDFGLAEALGSGSVAGGGGTYPYMAPEDFAEDAASDYRSDLWAVGVVLYEMLTGKRPFQVAARTRDPFAWKRAVTDDEPLPPSQVRPELPPAFDAIVRRALAKSKIERYASAGEFADALSAVGATLPATAPLAPPHHPSEPTPGTPSPTVEPRPPTGPADRFVFANGATAADLDTLLTLAARHWEDARAALLDGRIERFLRAIGEVYIADLAGELRGRSGDADRRLSEFLERSQAQIEVNADDRTIAANLSRHPWLPRPTVTTGAPNVASALQPVATVVAPPVIGSVGTVGAPPPVEPPFRAFDGRVVVAAPSIDAVPPPFDGGAVNPLPDTPSRWWFGPLYVICAGPVLGSIEGVLQDGRADHAFAHLALGCVTTGFLGAILLLIGLRIRIPLFAKVLCGVPVAVGLIAAGSFTSRTLATQPNSDGLMLAGVLLLLPIGALLIVAATTSRLYRLWAWVALLIALGLTVELARPSLPRMVQSTHRFTGERF